MGEYRRHCYRVFTGDIRSVDGSSFWSCTTQLRTFQHRCCGARIQSPTKGGCVRDYIWDYYFKEDYHEFGP